MRQLLGLSLPLMGTMLATVAVPVVDVLMCGHIPDHGMSLSALGFAVQLWFLLNVASDGIAVGTVAVVSRAYGAGDVERVNRLVARSAQLALLLGAVIGIGAAILSEWTLRAIGASNDVAEAGASYLRMLMIGFPASFLAEGCLGPALRGLGNARIPFLCGLAGNVANVVLGYGLIFGKLGMPKLGIAGAGLGAAISRFVLLGLMILAIRRDVIPGVVLRLRSRAAARSGEMGQIIRVGIPSWLEKLTFYLTMIGLVSMLAHIDEISVAAHAIGARLAAFLLVPAFGTAQATGALVGNALGGGSVEGAKRILRLSCLMVAAMMLVGALATYAGAPWIAAAYDVPAGSLLDRYTVAWLRVVSFSVVLSGVLMAIGGLLLGAGATRTVMKINVASLLLVQLPLAAFLGFGTDLRAVGVWLSWPATLLVQLPLAFAAYRRGRWAVTGVHAAE
jgi:putative MATE family efflux protein